MTRTNIIRVITHPTGSFANRCCLLALFLLVLACSRANAQLAVKTNMLYWATTTPNLGAEVGLGEKTTGQVFFGLNPWRQSGGDHSSLRHWVLQPELRHWFCQKFNGWFVGAHAMGGQYNAGGVDLPLNILHTLEDHRYKGWYIGGGLTAGYQWPLSRHFSLEANIGAGYIYSPYKKYCVYCFGRNDDGWQHRCLCPALSGPERGRLPHQGGAGQG